MKQFFTSRRSVCRAFWPAVFGVLLLTSPAGMALQPNATRPVARLAKSPAPVRATTPEQQRLTVAAAAEGVQIEWNVGLGTPFSIRGADLLARKAFSVGKGLAISGHAAPEAKAIAVLDNLSGIMGMRDAQEEFAAQAVQTDTLGFQHVRATQTYQGLEVFGGKVIVHFDQDGRAFQVNGRYVPDITVDLNPQFTPDDALGRAVTDLAALDISGAAVLSPPELVIFAYQSQPRLAYALTLTANPPEENAWRYWIDAQNGAVLLSYNDVKSVDISGVILTGEGGTTNTITNCVSAGTTNYLWSSNWNWKIYNSSTNSTLYPDTNQAAFRTSTNWGTSDRTEMSAAVNFDYVQRYFYSVHGRNSYDTNGALAYAYVHVFDNYVNAFWSGAAFYFGDGDGLTANPLAVLDVAGHEFAHAVTQYSADLIYAYESGALNESFSDIFGAVIEFYYQPVSTNSLYLYPNKQAGKADWLLGEDCWVSSTALRDMRHPTNTTTVGSGNEQPNHYQGPYWYFGNLDNGGVHQNSGVQNYFFYLLSEGGTNIYGGVTNIVSGIGLTNAARIAYRTLTTYCYEFTDYKEVRSAWISAAQDLNSAWVASVTQAWEAVGYGNYTLADLGTALDATYLTWYTSGNSNWFAQTNFTYDGVSAAQSGTLTNNQQSRLQTTFSGAGTFSFWWKVSSESGWDYLRFFIDGQEQRKISGEANWSYYAYTNSSGARTATWLYVKDSYLANGYDAGWVDQVVWAPVWTPSVPAISATDGDYSDRIRISWSAISGATDYRLYRNTINNSNQADLVATVTSPTYDDTSVVPGSIYYYWMLGRSYGAATPLSAMDSGYRDLLAPTALAASKGSYTDGVRLTWTTAEGATSYQILRGTSADSATATVIIETGATSYNDTTAEPGVTYYYWLRSRKWRPTGTLSSSLSSGDAGWRRSMAAADNAPCDFDGDGKADPAVYQSATGRWLIMMSGNQYQITTFQLGGAGYAPVPQDYDGDGKADIAVYASGQWLAQLSAYSYALGTTSLGGPGSIPVPRDFDGDGQADPAVFEQSSGLWKAQLSDQGYSLTQGYFGDAGYTPCPADYDNDGSTDPAIFQIRQTVIGVLGYWIAAQSADAYATRTWNVGQSGQQTVPQDYDGDGQADPALYDAAGGVWNYWPSSRNSTIPIPLSIGGSGFVAVSGDYDGDRKGDATVYQEATGTWVALLSGSSFASPVTVVFGGSGYEAAAVFP